MPAPRQPFHGTGRVYTFGKVITDAETAQSETLYGDAAAWPRGDFNADGANYDFPNAPADAVKRGAFTRAELLSGIFPVSAFPTPAGGVAGNLGRNVFRGPGFRAHQRFEFQQFREGDFGAGAAAVPGQRAGALLSRGIL